MWQIGLGNCGRGATGAGFEGVVGETVYARCECFVVGAPADVEGGCVRPFLGVLRVGLGVGGYARGFAVGEEGWVGRDVGDYFVEVVLAVWEDTGGGEVLDGVEGGGEGSD